MTDAEKVAQARAILDMPLFHVLWDEMEASAVNACIYARATEDEPEYEVRAGKAAEARAIRNFRSKLNALVSEANTQRKGAPA
jgi:formylglycine-generating enzyme required for sulfatase activity